MTEAIVKIGSEVSKKSAKNLSNLIRIIFSEGDKHHMDQETIRAALALVGTSLAVSGTSISGCNIQGDKNYE